MKQGNQVTANTQPGIVPLKEGTRVSARGDLVTIANTAFTIPDGMLVQGISDPQSTNHTPIRLKMILSKDDLSRLTNLFMTNRNVFCDVFFEAMARPSILPPRKRQGGQGSDKVEHVSTLWQKRILNIPDGLRVQGINGFKSENHPPIELKTHLGTDDLARLIFVYNSSKDALCDAFFEAIILPSIEHLRKRRSGRGLNKGKEVSLRWLKREASELYHLFKFLIESGRRPPFFRRLVAEIEALKPDDAYKFYRFPVEQSREDFKNFIQNVTCNKATSNSSNRSVENLNPIVLAAYCIEKFSCLSSKCLPSLGVRSFITKFDEDSDDDYDSTFYQNYIRGAKPKYRDNVNLTDDEIEKRAREETPFYEIFGWIFNNEAEPCPHEGSVCASRYIRMGRMIRHSSQAEGKRDPES